MTHEIPGLADFHPNTVEETEAEHNLKEEEHFRNSRRCHLSDRTAIAESGSSIEKRLQCSSAGTRRPIISHQGTSGSFVVASTSSIRDSTFHGWGGSF
jgi:hypothetical protein